MYLLLDPQIVYNQDRIMNEENVKWIHSVILLVHVFLIGYYFSLKIYSR